MSTLYLDAIWLTRVTQAWRVHTAHLTAKTMDLQRRLDHVERDMIADNLNRQIMRVLDR